MKYLYGDATESPLDKNYIELLRDVLDFGVSVMLAHDNITRHKKIASDRQQAARHEHEQLEALNLLVEKALDGARRNTNAQAAARCIDSIRGAALAEVRRAEGGVQAGLTGEVTKIHEAIEREQANNVKRLETLLIRHDLPGCSLWVNARLSSKGDGYVAELIGKAPSEVAFVMDLEIPSGHLFSELMRVERLAPNLSIKVPEESGWVRKSVKLRAHKLGKEYVTGVSRTTKRATIKLRSAIQDPDTGYDLIFGTKNRVAIARVGKGQELEPFEPDQADKNELVAFFDELSRALVDLKGSRRVLRGAQLDGTPLAEHSDATVLVQRLIAQLAPIVQQISRHSLSPTELVLKRVLADDRREEIFLSKADLRAKLEPLPDHLRRIFDPLGLMEGPHSRPGGSTPAPPMSSPSATAVEIPHPSGPPPLSRTGPPAPAQPAHSQPGHSQPAHSQPAHSQPAHSQPPHAQPAQGQSRPVQSQPAAPMFPPSAPPAAPSSPMLADIPAMGRMGPPPMPQSMPAIAEDETAVRDEAPLPLAQTAVIPASGAIPEPTPPPPWIRTTDAPAAARIAAEASKGRTLRPASSRKSSPGAPGTNTPPAGTQVPAGVVPQAGSSQPGTLPPGATLPKPSAPPPRPVPRTLPGAGATPSEPGKKGDADSVDVQLDELLNND